MPPPQNPKAFVRLRYGSGLLTAANLNATPYDSILSWANEHCLYLASGGATECPWRWLSAATYAGFFFSGDNIGALNCTVQALHLSMITSGFQTALDAGISNTSVYGSLRAAIYSYVVFCRTQRSAHRKAFTFSDAYAFFPLPAGTGPQPPMECRWVEHVTLQMEIQDGDAFLFAWIINLLPGCWPRASRREDSFVDAAGGLLDAAAAINPRLAEAMA